MSGAGDEEEVPHRPCAQYGEVEKDPDNLVYVCVTIPGLKKKFLRHEASNAEYNLELDERSFSLSVTLNKSKKRPEKFLYKVLSLPGPIDTTEGKSYCTIEKDNEVMVYLRKQKPSSWARILAATGLETDEGTLNE